MEHIFEYIFWIVNHLGIRLCELIDIVMGNMFRGKFACFEGVSPKSRLFLIYQRTTINQKLIITGLWFLTCSRFIKKGKGSKYSQLKISRSHYSAILSNSWMAWNQFLVFSIGIKTRYRCLSQVAVMSDQTSCWYLLGF